MSGTRKKLLLAALFLAITLLHYSARGYHPTLHVLHRELYLVPIVLSAYWFGKKGGLMVAVASSIIFLPKVLLAEHVTTTDHLNNVLQVLAFIAVAYLIGHFQDVRRSHWRSFFRAPQRTRREARNEHGQAVLVCIDNSPDAAKAAHYVKDHFLRQEDTAVTILGFVREPSRDVFASAAEYERARAENERVVNELVGEAHRVLLEGGFPESAVTLRTVRISRESLAAKIMEEQRHLSGDTVVLAGAKMSKTQELILGNPAVKLVREADFSVVTVF